jgi:hypothetical protein
MANRLGEWQGEGTAAGSYFQHQIRDLKFSASNDLMDEVTLNEKVLAKPFSGPEPLPSS